MTDLTHLYGGFENRTALLPIHTQYSIMPAFFHLGHLANRIEEHIARVPHGNNVAAARLLTDGNKKFNGAATAHASASVSTAARRLNQAHQTYLIAAARINMVIPEDTAGNVRNSVGRYSFEAPQYFRRQEGGIPAYRAAVHRPDSEFNLNTRSARVARDLVKAKNPFTDRPKRSRRSRTNGE